MSLNKCRAVCIVLLISFSAFTVYSQSDETDISAVETPVPEIPAPEITAPEPFSPETPVSAVPLSTIPEMLRRPMKGEAPRYPIDRIIGELGQGSAPGAAFECAQRLISGIVTGNRIGIDSRDSRLLDSILAKYLVNLEEVDAQRFHLGGGRFEEDGSVSFLVRLVGRDKWITGELYLVNPADDDSENENWRLDDLILEEGKNIEEGKDPYQYDFTPYQRFF